MVQGVGKGHETGETARDIPARILVDGFKLTSYGGKGLAGHAVAMDRGHDVRSRFVDGRVDDVPRGVDRVHVPTLLDLAVLADQAEILGPHVAERLAVRVDPEVVRHDGVADRDVSARAFVVVPLVTEPPQGGGVVEFAVRPLGFEGFEFRDADAMHGFGVGPADLHVRAIGKLRRWRRRRPVVVAGDGVGGCHRRRSGL